MSLVSILFWAAAALIFYTYVLFPAMVFLRGFLRNRPYQQAKITPHVSTIIAAYNEADSIGSKLDNILALDYPRDRLEVIIASDGSDDGTDAIVRGYAGQGIRLLSLPRQGKAAALNAAVEASNGKILAFSDANSLFAPNAIRALVCPFADPQVGGVAGNQCYVARHSVDGSSDGEQSYWNFEQKLKRFQSRAGNAISATGAIYAIRRELFCPVPAGVTDDFVISTRIIAQGYRLVFAADAIAYEPVIGVSSIEFDRKVRVITRGLQAVLVMRELLNPFRYGFYAIQIFSHKVLRRLVVIPLLVLLLVSPLLWGNGPIYQAATLGQIVFYGCAVLGALSGRTRLGQLKPFAIPFFFCMVNAAALLAIFNMLRGYRIECWEPQHQAKDAGASITMRAS